MKLNTGGVEPEGLGFEWQRKEDEQALFAREVQERLLLQRVWWDGTVSPWEAEE